MGQREKYEHPNPFYRYAVKRFLARVGEAAKACRPKTILDLACAEGYVIRFLRAENPHLVCTGVDIDEAALRDARELNPGVPFRVMNIYDAGALKEPFDMALALEVFEHLTDVDRAFASLLRTRSNFFLLSVPHEPFFRGINFLRGRYLGRFGNIPEHVHTWSKREFKALVSQRFRIVGDYSSFPWTMLLAQKP